HQLTDRTHTAVAEVVDVVDLTFAVAQVDQRLDHGKDVFLAQNTHGVGCVLLEAHAHLHAANSREIVAPWVEGQRIEHRFSGVDCWRLARTHHPVDVEQRILTALVLVDRERIADVATDIDVVDVQDLDFFLAGILQNLQRLLVDLVASLEEDLTRGIVDDVFCKIGAKQVVIGRLDGLEALSASCFAWRAVILRPASTTISPVSASTRSVTALRPRKRSALYGM